MRTNILAHLGAIIALVGAALWVMKGSCGFDGVFRWDGEAYHSLVEKYLVTKDFSSLSPNDLPAWSNDIPSQSYFNRIGYYLIVRVLRHGLGIGEYTSYVLLDILPFIGAALLLYWCAYRYLSLGWLASFFASLWLVLLPPAKVYYHVVAHTGPLALFFMVFGYGLGLAERHKTAALVLAFGGLVQESVVFIAVYNVVALLAARVRPKLGWLIAYGLALVVTVVVPIMVVGQTSLRSFGYLPKIFELNRDSIFAHLLHNFNVIWIPFLLCLPTLKRHEALPLISSLLLAGMLLLGAVDWWRVWYGSLFVPLLPLAARYTRYFGKDSTSGVGVLLPFLLITGVLLLEPAWLDFARIRDPAMWPYFVTLGIFAYGSGKTTEPQLSTTSLRA